MVGIKLKHKPQEDFQAKYDNVSCDCGKHFGVGVWTAFDRAQRYAWFRDKYRHGYDNTRRQYLESYVRAHGAVQSNL